MAVRGNRYGAGYDVHCMRWMAFDEYAAMTISDQVVKAFLAEWFHERFRDRDAIQNSLEHRARAALAAADAVRSKEQGSASGAVDAVDTRLARIILAASKLRAMLGDGLHCDPLAIIDGQAALAAEELAALRQQKEEQPAAAVPDMATKIFSLYEPLMMARTAKTLAINARSRTGFDAAQLSGKIDQLIVWLDAAAKRQEATQVIASNAVFVPELTDEDIEAAIMDADKAVEALPDRFSVSDDDGKRIIAKAVSDSIRARLIERMNGGGE